MSTLTEAVRMGHAKSIADRFHPRLKISQASVQDILTKLSYSLKGPLEVSIYRLWSLESPEERSLLVPCADGEISIYTHYGYSQHYALILQILGQKELGRIFTTIVPQRSTWALGSFHYQTWTHNGKSWKELWEEGQEHFKRKDALMAYLKVDWAKKFLLPNPYFSYEAFEQVQMFQNSMLPQTLWEKQVKTLLPQWKVRYLGTLLAEEDLGLVLRLEAHAELNSYEMRVECGKVWTALRSRPELRQLGGLRCGFLLNREDGTADGSMGSLYIKEGSTEGKGGLPNG
ncbi:MAG: hypothetical protein HYW48_07615 [Deltaproteobacteria bacterium]|nr:hypothetical protein [Deltaproteobacteria bacterium]